MIDVVYPLSLDPSGEYKELKHSLRSLEKYGKNYSNVYIVGNLPSWCQNVIHIPCEDTYIASVNVVIKCDKAFKKTNRFVLMNDDFYLTDDVDLDRYPYFFKGEIHPEGKGSFDTFMMNTKEFLETNNLPVRNYSVHCPFIIERQLFNKRFMYMQRTDFCPSLRCLYGNSYCLGKKVKDVKYYDHLLFLDNPCHCVSSGNKCDISVLDSIFTEKSRFEK